MVGPGKIRDGTKSRYGWPARLMIIALMLILCSSMLLIRVNAETITEEPSRVINLVYDDSGSMVVDDNDNKTDAWCQAKYGVEVLAAMLGKQDRLNIYVMSDINKNPDAGPHLQLDGSNGAAENVAKVHKMVTTLWETPFQTVTNAYNDLTKETADEKWLVVFTDGVFNMPDKNGNQDPGSFFDKKADDIKVLYLAIGKAKEISGNDARDIYAYKASSDEILEKLTEVSAQIFNMHKIKADKSGAFSFDVPMRELTVFAQGENVDIKGIANGEGKNISGGAAPVNVRYSEAPETGKNAFPDPLVNKKLKGSVCTFTGDYDPGDYKVDAGSAETIEIYYKPNVEIAAFVTDSEGNEITDDISSLEAGEYNLEFALVRAGTKERIGPSELIPDVTYEAVITNNDKEQVYDPSTGKVTLEEGDVTIEAKAHYLDYNTVSSTLKYHIFKNKKIEFSMMDPEAVLTVTKKGMDGGPLKVKATLDGKDFTAEQWADMDDPSTEMKIERTFWQRLIRANKIKDVRLVKTDTPGVFDMFVDLPDKGPAGGPYSTFNISSNYDKQHGEELWSGESEMTVPINDDRPWFIKWKWLIIVLATLAAILALVLGYMPFIKNYLPKSLKRKPNVRCKPETPGDPKQNKPGRFEKDTWSTLIPYKSETGTLKYTPQGMAVTGAPKLQLKAIKGRRMVIVNTKDFVKKPYVKFDGMPIPKDAQPKYLHKISSNTEIKLTRPGWTFTCIPSDEFYGSQGKSGLAGSNKGRTKGRRTSRRRR